MLEWRGIPFTQVHPENAHRQWRGLFNESADGCPMAKVVVVMADGRPVELVIPARRRIDMELAKVALDCELVRLATEEEMTQFFDVCEVGAVPPIRHWKDVEVVMDPALDMKGEMLLQPGLHGGMVKLDFTDWFNKVRPRVELLCGAEEVATA